MHLRPGHRSSLVLALAMGLAPLAPAGSARAQGITDLRLQTTRGIGYAATVPDAMVGAGVWQIFGTSRLGVFVDGKMTLPQLKNDANYCPSALATCDVAWVESNRLDQELSSEIDWLILNAGAVYAASSSFAFMLGAGMVRRSTYHQYVDDNEIPEARITWEGNYYVPGGEKWEPQAVVGALMRIAPRVAFTFGIETGPRTMAIGAYLVLP